MQAGGRSACATLHYVSNSPWQLARPVRQFLATFGFPVTSLHLKAFHLGDRTWRSLLQPPERGKSAAISSLLARLPPRRRVLLIGDSGERDPELYATVVRLIASKCRIVAVAIRHVTDGIVPATPIPALTSASPSSDNLLLGMGGSPGPVPPGLAGDFGLLQTPVLSSSMSTASTAAGNGQGSSLGAARDLEAQGFIPVSMHFSVAEPVGPAPPAGGQLAGAPADANDADEDDDTNTSDWLLNTADSEEVATQSLAAGGADDDYHSSPDDDGGPATPPRRSSFGGGPGGSASLMTSPLALTFSPHKILFPSATTSEEGATPDKEEDRPAATPVVVATTSTPAVGSDPSGRSDPGAGTSPPRPPPAHYHPPHLLGGLVSMSSPPVTALGGGMSAAVAAASGPESPYSEEDLLRSLSSTDTSLDLSPVAGSLASQPGGGAGPRSPLHQRQDLPEPGNLANGAPAAAPSSTAPPRLPPRPSSAGGAAATSGAVPTSGGAPPLPPRPTDTGRVPAPPPPSLHRPGGGPAAAASASASTSATSLAGPPALSVSASQALARDRRLLEQRMAQLFDPLGVTWLIFSDGNDLRQHPAVAAYLPRGDDCSGPAERPNTSDPSPPSSLPS
ncbi:hypothetical protein H696_02889 [Fonticula alba]|uniref:Phosphatidate phosphatase APP1 catalytic domain-containing protein n=1 Tax=Fonticula alba TaxID=691883 RepID=A0A058Z9G9_FONAL|nr:hypothetical protein H696_02889 [Fonticula alba]KCV70543.1 hypothetical protein H696_02889 [Fonticula alba]|eukprot:XP_009495059.1 hypothetical protein H696_02889 [Fonticula alba]